MSPDSEISRMLSLFSVQESDLRLTVAEAMKSGAGWADLYFECCRIKSLMLIDSQVSSGSTQIDYGVGIRALCGEKTGYSYTQSTALKDMLRAAAVAGSIACSCAGTCSPVEVPPLHVLVPPGKFYEAGESWDGVSNTVLSGILMDIDRRVRERDSRIVKVMARISCSTDDLLMYNSLGQLCCDSRPMGTVSLSIVFASGETTESRSASRSFRMGAEMLSQRLVDELIDKVCGGIDTMLEARRPKGGRMQVVMGAGASGILLHEAMGHAFEADFNRKGQSVFSDKMGKQVCPKGIDIVDDATWKGNRGSIAFDDEGVPGQKTYMVRDGVLCSYLHDRISAAYYGVDPTGNGRREGFRNNPIPRMRLTYMESGNARMEDMIASVRNGLYVDEFSNGQVKIGEGDFTFYVKSGYLIENGRLTMPVKDINVIGNGPEVLENIMAVGDDLKVDDSCWTCGKDQSVAVGCGMPSVLIRELIVGGE